MTVIEFFDSTPVDNILSSLTVDFNKIIFIGECKNIGSFRETYQTFAEKKGLNIEIVYRNINKNQLQDIVDTLSQIVEEEDECVFDLNGGVDLGLVAMGIVYQKYPDKKIQLQHYNVNIGRMDDCDNDGVVVLGKNLKLTVEEFIEFHGGKVKYFDETSKDVTGTHQWNYSEDFIKDVDALWEICRQNPKYWNSAIRAILNAGDLPKNKNELTFSINVSTLQNFLKGQNDKIVYVKELLKSLQREKLINNLIMQNSVITFEFKNNQIKKSLTKEGTVLELKVLTTALRATYKDGKPMCNDCMNGVYIDWDGGEMNKNDTFNEIDVMLLAGVIPFFISCKNGQVGDDELYKLESVANRFGGTDVKKVLIATYLGKGDNGREHFLKRAKDMGIILIDKVHLLNQSHFKGVIKHLINSGKIG